MKKRIPLIGMIVLGVGAGVLIGMRALGRRKASGDEQVEESVRVPSKKRHKTSRD